MGSTHVLPVQIDSIPLNRNTTLSASARFDGRSVHVYIYIYIYMHIHTYLCISVSHIVLMCVYVYIYIYTQNYIVCIYIYIYSIWAEAPAAQFQRLIGCERSGLLSDRIDPFRETDRYTLKAAPKHTEAMCTTAMQTLCKKISPRIAQVAALNNSRFGVGEGARAFTPRCFIVQGEPLV